MELIDHHAQGDRPGQRRAGAGRHAPPPPPPATCSPSRASPSARPTGRASTWTQGLLNRMRAAGLPGAGRPSPRQPAPIAHERVETPDPEAFVGEEKVVVEGVDGEQVTTYRITYVDGVETARETLSTRVDPRAGHRAGHGRHQGAPGRPGRRRRRAELGPAGEVRGRRQLGRSTPATATTAACSSTPRRGAAYGGSSGLPPPGQPGAADRDRARRSTPRSGGYGAWPQLRRPSS